MFKRILRLEATKLVIKRNIVLLAIIFAFLAFFSWNGINDYKLLLANKKPFQEVEKDKVKMHLHYTFYGIRGVRLLLIPTPFSVLFNDAGVFRGMTAHIDTAEKLDIANSFKGKDLFADKSGYMDFSGIMLLIGTCLALAYGYEIPLHREHLRLLADAYGSPAPVHYIVLARIILINLVFWGLSLLSLLWLFLNGVNALGFGFLLYLLGLTLVLTSFVLTGAIVGAMNNRAVQIITLMAVYFSMVIFIPGMIHQMIYIEAKKNIQSIYDFEYETFKYIMSFEKRYYDRFGILKSGEKPSEEALDMIRSRWDNEYKKLRRTEKNRLVRLKSRATAYQDISALFPTTFYLSMNKELSSKGFQSFMDFYQYAYDLKHEFVRFYVERKIYRPSKKRGVEPFIKGNEDLFYAQSHLPGSFKFGLTVSLVWIGLLVLLLWHRFNQLIQLSSTAKKTPVESIINLKKNKVTTVITSNPAKIAMATASVRFYHERTIRVPGWTCLSEDMKVEDYFSLFSVPLPEQLQPVAGRYCDDNMPPHQRAMIIIEIIRHLGAGVFIFNEFLAGLPDGFLSYFKESLQMPKKQGRSIVYFTGSILVANEIGNKSIRLKDESIYD